MKGLDKDMFRVYKLPKIIKNNKELFTGVKLFSYGGSGFKFLNSFINKYLSVKFPSNIHSYIHHTKPNINYKTLDKIIFVYRDPRNALLSHIRRCDRFRKLGDDYFFSTRRFVQLSIPFGISKKLTLQDISLKTFLEDYPDFLDFTGFFLSWLKFKHPKLLFLKYEFLQKNTKELAAFLELPEVFALQLQKTFVCSKADYKVYPKNIVDLLNNNYKELLLKQNNIPAFYIQKIF